MMSVVDMKTGDNSRTLARKVLFVRSDAGTVDPRVQKESSSLGRLGYNVFVFGWDRKREFPKEEVINDVRFRRAPPHQFVGE